MLISQLNHIDFSTVCWDIARGLGFEPKDFRAERFHADVFLRGEFVRESSDGMFRTDESWLCAFFRLDHPLGLEDVKPLVDVVTAARTKCFLGVVFGAIEAKAGDWLRQKLETEGVQVVLFPDTLSETLVCDYSPDRELHRQFTSDGFSFARLRRKARALVDGAPWRVHFQTTHLQPARLLPLHKRDEVLAEADLNGALLEDSFLLLGEPGIGKTTNLLMLARELARVGGRTPVVLPLGRYSGDFWKLLCEALAPDSQPVTRHVAQDLLESGGLVLMLDGINEIRDVEQQRQLVEDLNLLTAPDRASARSRWIVSGRVSDYSQLRVPLLNLENHRWEMQPLSEDLIYRLLADALGDAEGMALYQEMGESVRDICANPLLLTMVLAVYRQTGRTLISRSALYHQFTQLLLNWGEERGGRKEERRILIESLPAAQNYETLAMEALTSLATTMLTTALPWSDAQREFMKILAPTAAPMQTARLMLEDLTRCGILRRDDFNRLSFYHHTFQEYFRARAILQKDISELIPSSGVLAAERETVIFAATMIPDPAPMIRRALDVDLLLAYAIVRDVIGIVPEDIVREVAAKVWAQIRAYSRHSRTVGSNRRWAQVFRRMATLRGQTVESLAADVDRDESLTTQTQRLIGFYRELGDYQAQERIINKAGTGDHIPDDLLFSAAQSKSSSGDNKQAVELYSRFLEKYPNHEAAYHNRGLCYQDLGRKEEALADHQRAVELDGDASNRTSLAKALYELGHKSEAIIQIQRALKEDPCYSLAHVRLAGWLGDSDPAALQHRELAARFSAHDDDLRLRLVELSDLQEKLGLHAGVMFSLRRLIALSPTSPSVHIWKHRIARARQNLDTEARARSARERLQEQGGLPLPTLTFEWLRAAGQATETATAIWFLTRGGRGPRESLPVVLLNEPHITGSGLRNALDALPREIRQSSHILLVTAAETLSLEARHQLAALQDEWTVALVTALEIRDAILLDDLQCSRLLDRVLNRAGRTANPYLYKGIVLEHTEFFGRVAELESLMTSIGSGQHIGLYGIYKIGKSSLLESLRRKLHLNHPEISVLKVELDASLREAGDFYRLVIERLPGAQSLLSTSMVSAHMFRRILTDYHVQRQRDLPNHRLLIMIDEYAYLIPDRSGRGGINDYISVLGLLKALCQEGWLQILPCGRTATLNRQAKWNEAENPFIGLLTSRFLGPLTREENNTLMTSLGMRAGMSFTEDALEAIFRETGGHPAFSRELGEQLVGIQLDRITELDIRKAVDSFLANRDLLSIPLGIYEDQLDADEQRLARIIALEGSQPRKALFPDGADIMVRRRIRDALANLLDTTVLAEEPDGRIGHRYGLLRRVIALETEQLGLE